MAIAPIISSGVTAARYTMDEILHIKWCFEYSVLIFWSTALQYYTYLRKAIKSQYFKHEREILQNFATRAIFKTWSLFPAIIWWNIFGILPTEFSWTSEISTYAFTSDVINEYSFLRWKLKMKREFKRIGCKKRWNCIGHKFQIVACSSKIETVRVMHKRLAGLIQFPFRFHPPLQFDDHSQFLSSGYF